MAEWKVSREQIKLFPHPNADRLEVARVGTYSLVVQKGIYQDGEIVVFAPRDSLLPDNLAEPFKDMLSTNNRVREVRLRGEPSQGVVLKETYLGEYGVSDVALGEDISERLGIREYIRPVPLALRGNIASLRVTRPDGTVVSIVGNVTKFDVEQYRIFSDEIVEGEEVIITEKAHGSQINLLYAYGQFFVSSKGILRQGLAIEQSDANSYWQAVENTDLQARILKDITPHLHHAEVIQVVGEMIPCQKGFTYGATAPTIRVFDVLADRQSVSQEIKDKLADLWVPVLYRGAFSEELAVSLSKGMEQVSGKQLHIREGCVVTPNPMRYASQGNALRLKFINPKYKETGEEFN